MRKVSGSALYQNQAELDAFVQVLDRLVGFSERVGTEWADGYLTALAAGPRAVAIEEWLPLMCGDAFDRCFADPQDAGAAKTALQRRAKWLLRQLDPERLLDDPQSMQLAPLIYEANDEETAQVQADTLARDGADAAREQGLDPPSIGNEWSRGFFDALHDFGADWSFNPNDSKDDNADNSDNGDFESLLAAVEAMAWADGSAEHTQCMTRAFGDHRLSRDELILEACFAVQDLRVWWLDHGFKHATVYSEPKPGRNEPCPCGSGKKYKKCHGAT